MAECTTEKPHKQAVIYFWSLFALYRESVDAHVLTFANSSLNVNTNMHENTFSM